MIDASRLHQCRDALIERVLHDGGWGLRRAQFSSISNTAEAVAVFRTANVPLHHPIVVSGLDYLAKNVNEHPKPKEQGGRDPHTRYAVHVLRGFSEYPESLFEKRYRDGFFAAWRWLQENNRAGGGWTEWPEQANLSLFATANVALALQRCGIPNLRHDLARIRRAIRSEGRAGSKGVSWKQNPSDRAACPASTAWAVLALAGSMEEEDLESARGGIEWLLKNRERWQGKPTEDRNVEGTAWRHVTPALGLRAVLSGVAEISPDNRRLYSAWDFIDKLWRPERREWAHDLESAESLAGNYAVAMVYESWISNLRQGRPSEVRPTLSVDQPIQLAMRSEKFVLVEEGEGLEKPLRLGPRLMWLLRLVVDRAAEGGVVSEDELRASAPTITEKGAFRKYSWRINKEVAKQSQGRVPLVINRDVVDGMPVYSLEIPLQSAPKGR